MDLQKRSLQQRAAHAVRLAALGSALGPALAGVLLLGACEQITNSPHALGAEKTNTFFSAFQERSPKYLDSTASYALDETPYTYSIYEPLYRFHYLKRPYEIAPRTAEAVAQPKFFDKAGKRARRTTRRASWWPRRSTTSGSGRASCTRRTRPSPRTPTASTCTTR